MDDRTDQQQTRWMGAGRSGTPDSRTAAMEAAQQALAQRPDAELLLVFASAAHDPEQVSAGINAVSGGVPMVGCSSHGEIGEGGPRDGSVSVCALGGPGFSVATAAVGEAGGRQREAGAEIAACVDRLDDELPHRVLILLTDGLVADQEEILRGAYSVLGASVPLFGGAAADCWEMRQTFQLCDDAVVRSGVVAAAIASEAPLGIGIGHGWHTVGEPMMVTSSDGGELCALDDEPALDAYLQRFGAPEEIAQDADALSLFALARPMGIQRRGGDEVRNFSTGIDVERRSVRPGGDIHQGGLVWAMEGDCESIIDGAEVACRQALAAVGDQTPVGLLTFSCAALRAVLGDDGIQDEGRRLDKLAGDVPYAGFYTYGEIARPRGVDGFHNQTHVVLAIG